uniref:Uncharacterized protein n=1 Tax=Siphoviridae sp. ctcj91 TaxID=2826395 RepID=A0A8S5QWQ7_9CAUD|nr:MAG TPA: hypothetical protein [Siphoviridae sp. ctcj91]
MTIPTPSYMITDDKSTLPHGKSRFTKVLRRYEAC